MAERENAERGKAGKMGKMVEGGEKMENRTIQLNFPIFISIVKKERRESFYLMEIFILLK